MNRIELKELIAGAKTKRQNVKHKIFVCCGTSCMASDSETVLKVLQEEIKAQGLENEVEAALSGCMGLCNQGPLVKVSPDNTIYQKITCETIKEVVQGQFINKEPIKKLLLFADTRPEPFINAEEDPFFKNQKKIILKE